MATKIKALASRAANQYSLLSASKASGLDLSTRGEISHDSLGVGREHHHGSDDSLYLLDAVDLLLKFVFVQEHVVGALDDLATPVTFIAHGQVLLVFLREMKLRHC